MLKKFTYKNYLVVLGLTVSLVWLAVLSFPDSKLHLVFCDVGQGDAVLITQGFNQILIDGGPNDKVLTCLKNNLPFFDRKIEIIALTHPEADHLTGLISVLDKYSVDYFLMGPEKSESAVFQKLILSFRPSPSTSLGASSASGGIPLSKSVGKGFLDPATGGTRNDSPHIVNPYSGDKIKIGNIVLDTWWPEREWVAEHIVIPTDPAIGGRVEESLSLNSRGKGSLGFLPAGRQGARDDINNYQGNGLTASDDNSNILGYSSTKFPLNQFSLVLLLNYQGKKILLMGDGDSSIQKNIMENNTLLPIDILKFPHHGSKMGMSEGFLELIQPREAVISVGKNSYGHPTNEALEMLRKVGAKIRRTDLEGEIKYSF